MFRMGLSWKMDKDKTIDPAALHPTKVQVENSGAINISPAGLKHM